MLPFHSPLVLLQVGTLRPREGAARTQTWTSGSPSCPLSAPFGSTFLRTQSCGTRGSVVASRQAFQKPEARARGRPDPLLWPLSMSLSQGRPCLKEAFAIISFFSSLIITPAFGRCTLIIPGITSEKASARRGRHPCQKVGGLNE